MMGAAARAGLTDASWAELFDFLDPDRSCRPGPTRDAEAQARYLEITRKLVCFFAGRGCRDAEDLAAETVLRVTARCRDVDVSGHEDRAGYFFGVARNVYHEWLRHELKDSSLREAFRQELTRIPPIDLETRTGREAVHRCLDRCLARLTWRARRLVIAYYSTAGAASAASHRELAGQFGKSPNALRIEVHRIRKTLQPCVFGCLHPEHPEPTARNNFSLSVIRR